MPDMIRLRITQSAVLAHRLSVRLADREADDFEPDGDTGFRAALAEAGYQVGDLVELRPVTERSK